MKRAVLEDKVEESVEKSVIIPAPSVEATEKKYQLISDIKAITFGNLTINLSSLTDEDIDTFSIEYPSLKNFFTEL